MITRKTQFNRCSLINVYIGKEKQNKNSSTNSTALPVFSGWNQWLLSAVLKALTTGQVVSQSSQQNSPQLRLPTAHKQTNAEPSYRRQHLKCPDTRPNSHTKRTFLELHRLVFNKCKDSFKNAVTAFDLVQLWPPIIGEWTKWESTPLVHVQSVPIMNTYIMMTSSNGNIFPLQMPVARSFDVFFHLRLNKQLSKHSRRRCFQTPSPWLWRHCNDPWVGTLPGLMLTCLNLTPSNKQWNLFREICSADVGHFVAASMC